MRRIRTVALVIALLLVAFAVTCREGLIAPVHMGGVRELAYKLVKPTGKPVERAVKPRATGHSADSAHVADSVQVADSVHFAALARLVDSVYTADSVRAAESVRTGESVRTAEKVRVAETVHTERDDRTAVAPVADAQPLVRRVKRRHRNGGAMQHESAVTENKVGLSVATGPEGTIISGDVYPLTAWFGDSRAAAGPWRYEVNWGAGAPTTAVTSSPGVLYASHRYLAAGTYTATLRVTDNGTRAGASATTVHVLRLPVELDVQPGDRTKAINLADRSRRDVVVALLASQSFDPGLVDLTTVHIGDAPVAKQSGRYAASSEDVNGDGRPDLVLHFNLADLMSKGGLNAGSTFVTLLADLTDGRQITATDMVRVK